MLYSRRSNPSHGITGNDVEIDGPAEYAVNEGSDLLLHRAAGVEGVELLANVNRLNVDEVLRPERTQVVFQD